MHHERLVFKRRVIGRSRDHGPGESFAAELLQFFPKDGVSGLGLRLDRHCRTGDEKCQQELLCRKLEKATVIGWWFSQAVLALILGRYKRCHPKVISYKTKETIACQVTSSSCLLR